VTLLVDTHAFLWFMTGDGRLSATARRAMENASAAWCLSAASVWEMAIKSSLGRLTLPAAVAEYVAGKVRAGLVVLPVEWSHAAAVEILPHHHGDPFDRLIIAQAQAEGLSLVTRDAVFRDYGVRVIW
jgi:PIN domain nuclease of toxin-antitoxin system